ncbi:MAG: outer membrane beta-barrel protein [Kiritimatiellaeota bacterium]|nr:outer membrane beta-barrel protein [Kiritimatiellota bacterium]
MKKWMMMAMLTAWVSNSYAVRLGQGTQALDLSGFGDFTSSSEQLKVGYGYFIMDYLEVGGLFEVAHSQGFTAYALGPKAEYNFDLDVPVVPFVGAALLFQHTTVSVNETVNNPVSGLPESVSADESKNALSLTVMGGAKFFITDAFAISADLALSAATSDVYPKKDGDAGKTDVRLELGLRYYF